MDYATYGVLGRGAVLLGGGLAVACRQRRGRLEHVHGELPLAGQQLLGEVVGARDELVRRGHLVRERDAQLRQLRGHRLDLARPGLDRLDDRGLALADRVQDFVLQLTVNGAGFGHGSSSGSLCMLLTILST